MEDLKFPKKFIISYNNIEKEIKAPDTFSEFIKIFLKEFNMKDASELKCYYLDEDDDQWILDKNYYNEVLMENKSPLKIIFYKPEYNQDITEDKNICKDEKYSQLDTKIKNEVILLSHLEKKNNDLSNDMNLKENCLKKYYKINNQKMIELEKTFKISKLKVYLHKIINLGNDKICGISRNKECIIYENKYFNKLFEIKIDNLYNINSIIELDNNDLIFFTVDVRYLKNELLIYRLKDKDYILFQKITEDKKGYITQKEQSGCTVFEKKYFLKNIVKLSNNRFMCISNYGIKIYSLNKSNQYSLVLMHAFNDPIKTIYEIDENKLILCKIKINDGICRRPDQFIIEKIDIKNITNDEINQKINEFKEKDEQFRDIVEYKKLYKENYKDFLEIDFSTGYLEQYNCFISEIEKIISCLKLTIISQMIYEYSLHIYEYKISDFIFLKSKYFIISVNNQLFIFNLLNFELMKIYTIESPFYTDNYDIKKWDNENDNEFLFILGGDITLFELNENNINGQITIILNVIAYIYFPYKYPFVLNKLDVENRFYIKKDDKNEDDNNYILLF